MPVSPWSNIPMTVGPVARGGPAASIGYVCQAVNLTWSWGTRPASGELTYIENGTQVPVAVGSELTLAVPGQTFYGICVADSVAKSARGGVTRKLTFADSREFLTWDQVFGAFNLRDVRLEGGERVRRYRSLLPADAFAGIWTFHDEPFTGAEIIGLLFAAPTVYSAWSSDGYSMGLFGTPVYELDFQSGPNLDSALQQMGDRLGLVMTLKGGRYRLVWERKGIGTPPANLNSAIYQGGDNRELGLGLSGHPNTVRILGERNLYQLQNIEMVKDWAAGWEAFWSEDKFILYIHDNFKTDMAVGPIAADTPYATVPGDADGYVGNQLAADRALRITVAQFADLKDALSAGTGAAFRDRRKFGGRSRMNMPAILYIRTLLFKAFRPPTALTLETADGFIPIKSLQMVPRLVARVDFAVTTGVMTAHNDGVIEGNGFAVAQGYNVSAGLFRLLLTNRFDPARWVNAQDHWQAVPFQVDESGEDGGFIIFDEVVIRSANLVTRVNGHTVMVANPTITPANVRATLTFAANRFRYVQGDTSQAALNYRNATVQVSALNAEFVAEPDGSAAEVPYADGFYAFQKAQQLAGEILQNRMVYLRGSVRYHGLAGTQLSSLIDRVSFERSAAGAAETAQFAWESPTNAFDPERAYERRSQLQNLFPGQEQLRVQSEDHRILALALRQSPASRRTMTEQFTGYLGGGYPVQRLNIEGGTGTLPVGTPLWSPGMVPNPSTGAPENMRPVMPSAVSTDHKVFRGVTVRQDEDAAKTIAAAPHGIILVRAKGPVVVGDTLGKEAGADYLAVDGEPAVGKARQAISGTGVQLIETSVGGGGGTGGDGRWQ